VRSKDVHQVNTHLQDINWCILGCTQGGLLWYEGMGAVLLGSFIVVIPIILNGRAGARYGVPFPVLARASFGLRGANLPALLRAFVAVSGGKEGWKCLKLQGLVQSWRVHPGGRGPIPFHHCSRMLLDFQ
jgi:hypothetical protein